MVEIQNCIINPNQGHPLAFRGLAAHNNNEKHDINCRHYKLMEEKRSSITKVHENLDPPRILQCSHLQNAFFVLKNRPTLGNQRFFKNRQFWAFSDLGCVIHVWPLPIHVWPLFTLTHTRMAHGKAYGPDGVIHIRLLTA